MYTYPRNIFSPFLVLTLGLLLTGLRVQAQQTKTSVSTSQLPPDKAISLAEQGKCRESISALKHVVTSQLPAETRKRAGVVGVRCALSIDDRAGALDFLRSLNKDFPQ